MEWFNIWWSSLGLVGQIMACSAISMTVVMILQFILLIIGVGFGGETDGDAELDSNVDTDLGADGATEFTEHIDITPDSDTVADISEISTFVDKAAKETDGHGTGILKIFTIRGIVAFFALGGWAGLAALSAGVPAFWAVQIAVLVGVAALLLASFVIRLALRMQESGNLNLKNTLEHTAEVYIRIPPAREEKGKVTMLLQERFVELDAVTDSDVELLPNTKVSVVALADNECLVVSPIE